MLSAVSDVHFENARELIVVILAFWPNVIADKLAQFSNADKPIVTKLSAKVTELTNATLANESLSTVVPDKTVTFNASGVAPPKITLNDVLRSAALADSGRLPTNGILMFSKLEQSTIAFNSISSTVVGIINVFKLLQFWKAPSLTTLTVDGIVNDSASNEEG